MIYLGGLKRHGDLLLTNYQIILLIRIFGVFTSELFRSLSVEPL